MILFNFSAHASAVYVSIFHLPSNCRTTAPAAYIPQLSASSVCVCVCWCCDCYRCREIFIQPPKYVMLFFRAAVAHCPSLRVPHQSWWRCWWWRAVVSGPSGLQVPRQLSCPRFHSSSKRLPFLSTFLALSICGCLSLSLSVSFSGALQPFSCVRCGKLWQIHTLTWLTCRPQVHLFPWPWTMAMHAPVADQTDSVVNVSDRPSAFNANFSFRCVSFRFVFL